MTVDMVIASAIWGLWRFGMYAPDETRIAETMTAIKDQLTNNADAGRIARYSNDYYFRVEPDTRKVPGNPRFICTLRLAQWHIALAKTTHDLQPARALSNWAGAHQLPAGLLSQQLDPNTRAPPP